MTWGGLLRFGEDKLKEAGIADWKTDAWLLFEAAFGITRTRYFLCANEEIPGEAGLYLDYLSRRVAREPVQYILGRQEFMGLTFHVDKNVLIPRQDTETLVEAVLADNRDTDISILDLCTGSGCIAISLAAIGGYRSVTAADISEDALAVARSNATNILRGNPGRLSDAVILADNAKVRGSFSLRKSDMFADLGGDGGFDVITCNPPYIPSAVIGTLEPEVRDFEPRLALDGDADGLAFYRRLAEGCKNFLNINGRVYFEIGHDQAAAVKGILETAGFSGITAMKDLAGNDRVVRAAWRG